MSLCLGQPLFPHPAIVKKGAVTPGDLYRPIAMTLPEVCRWYYGINKLKVSLDLNMTFAASTPSTSVSQFVGTLESDLDSVVTDWNNYSYGNEIDYLFEDTSNFDVYNNRAIWHSELLSDGDEDVAPTGAYSEWRYSISDSIILFRPSTYDAPVDQASIIDDDGTFYPFVYIYFDITLRASSIELGPGGGSSNHEILIEVGSDPSLITPFGSPFSMDANFLGRTIPLGGYMYEDNNSSGSTSASITGALPTKVDITVGKWWPYDPGDGLGPIWDVDTGAKLRNKF